MASVLLIVLMVVTVQLLAWVAAVRRAVDHRHWAVAEAANVMEELTAQPWDQLTPDRAAELELSPHTRALLPEATLSVAVTSAVDGLPAKRLDVEVRWLVRPGQPDAKVRLTAWVYQEPESNQ